MELREEIRSILRSIEPELVAFRNKMHQEPELSFQEFKTTEKLASFLTAEGISFERFEDCTGLSVNLVSDGAGNEPLLLLRADIDALPIQDTKSVSHRSQHLGIMHACGHDVHTSVVLGILVALNRLRSRTKFRVRAIFQPAEELGKGAKALIDRGVLDEVKYCLSLHVDPNVPAGKVAVQSGPINAADIEFAVSFRGKESHVARLHLGVDTIGPACTFINQCYAQIPKKVDPCNPHILYFGSINGGVASNIVSAKTDLLGTIRAFQSDTASKVYSEVKKIVSSVAEATGVEFQLEERVNLKAVVNDAFIAEKVLEAATAAIGEKNLIRELPPSMGAEDFGEISSLVPGAMIKLGIAAGSEAAPGLHTSNFDAPGEVIALGAEVLVNAVLHLTETP